MVDVMKGQLHFERKWSSPFEQCKMKGHSSLSERVQVESEMCC